MSETGPTGSSDPASADGKQWETLNETVWVSLAFYRTARLKEATNNISLVDLDTAGEVCERNVAGEPQPLGSFPKEFYGRYSDRKLGKLRDLVQLGGWPCVSAACKEVLQQFDLGNTSFYPIKVFEFDQTTPVPGEFFCLAFGETKEAFLPEESTGVRGNRYQDPVREWRAKGGCEDGQIAVDEVALKGVDLWIDPKLYEGVFMSDALVKALRAAKMGGLFEFRKCRVLRAT